MSSGPQSRISNVTRLSEVSQGNRSRTNAYWFVSIGHDWNAGGCGCLKLSTNLRSTAKSLTGDRGEDVQGALASGISWQVIFYCAIWHRCSAAPRTGAVIAILPMAPALWPYHQPIYISVPRQWLGPSWRDSPGWYLLPSLQIRHSTV